MDPKITGGAVRYVGLSVAVAFARAGATVVGFDVSTARIAKRKSGWDQTLAVDAADLQHPNLIFSADDSALAKADFFSSLPY
jgi:UDP-N-acetyl-D-galactosamine dehydrogenase